LLKSTQNLERRIKIYFRQFRPLKKASQITGVCYHFFFTLLWFFRVEWKKKEKKSAIGQITGACVDCRVKNMFAMYLKNHKDGLAPTTPVTSTAISPVKMLIGHKSLTNLRSEMIFLQGKPVFYIILPSTPPYWQIILRFYWQWTPTWLQKGK
jgi:hypothetical protein